MAPKSQQRRELNRSSLSILQYCDTFYTVVRYLEKASIRPTRLGKKKWSRKKEGSSRCFPLTAPYNQRYNKLNLTTHQSLPSSVSLILSYPDLAERLHTRLATKERPLYISQRTTTMVFYVSAYFTILLSPPERMTNTLNHDTDMPQL